MLSVRKTTRAYLNCAAILLQRRLGTTRVRGYPITLTLDPSSACQLRCPFCPTGRRQGERTVATMSLEKFRGLMNELGPYLFHIDLFNWGEPLLHPNFNAMVRCVREYGATAGVSTNLSFEMTDQEITDLLECGLEALTVSLDGITEEKYVRYRVGGQFDLVLGNLKRLAQRKRELGLEKPIIVWQLLVFRYNEEDLDRVREMAAEMEVDLRLGSPHVDQTEQWRDMTPINPDFNLYNPSRGNLAVPSQPPAPAQRGPQRCGWLYASAAVNANGAVSPCCAVWDQKDDFGHLEVGRFRDVYNNAMYQRARSGHAISGTSQTICERCPVPPIQEILEPLLDQIIETASPRFQWVLRKLRGTPLRSAA